MFPVFKLMMIFRALANSFLFRIENRARACGPAALRDFYSHHWSLACRLAAQKWVEQTRISPAEITAIAGSRYPAQLNFGQERPQGFWAMLNMASASFVSAIIIKNFCLLPFLLML